MDEYISRGELRKHLKECYDDELFDTDMKKAVIGIDIYVENMPAVDVQPVKHGRWVKSNTQKHVEVTYECSECQHEVVGEYEKTPFCGGCGARMMED